MEIKKHVAQVSQPAVSQISNLLPVVARCVENWHKNSTKLVQKGWGGVLFFPLLDPAHPKLNKTE
jgi:DMSO/TMAO reductase YedYZ molybdopterin-dependent catalytic subunit